MMKRKKIVVIITIVLFVIGLIFGGYYFYNKFNTTILPEPTPPIEDLHSDLYISGVSVEEVITYFNEVSLDAEMVNDGDPSKLQKWVEPIYYFLNDGYTEDDLVVILNFVNWLNKLDGFPGIYETKDLKDANLRIYFGNQKKMLQIMGNNFGGLDGGVTFWYLDNKIYDETIFYRTDIDQEVRNSVILEEIYNGLGPVQDTDIRTDSIIYSGFSKPQELTEIDELILKLMYNPKMLPGMNALECEKVIRQLYY